MEDHSFRNQLEIFNYSTPLNRYDSYPDPTFDFSRRKSSRIHDIFHDSINSTDVIVEDFHKDSGPTPKLYKLTGKPKRLPNATPKNPRPILKDSGQRILNRKPASMTLIESFVDGKFHTEEDAYRGEPEGFSSVRDDRTPGTRRFQYSKTGTSIMEEQSSLNSPKESKKVTFTIKSENSPQVSRTTRMILYSTPKSGNKDNGARKKPTFNLFFNASAPMKLDKKSRNSLKNWILSSEEILKVKQFMKEKAEQNQLRSNNNNYYINKEAGSSRPHPKLVPLPSGSDLRPQPKIIMNMPSTPNTGNGLPTTKVIKTTMTKKPSFKLNLPSTLAMSTGSGPQSCDRLPSLALVSTPVVMHRQNPLSSRRESKREISTPSGRKVLGQC